METAPRSIDRARDLPSAHASTAAVGTCGLVLALALATPSCQTSPSRGALNAPAGSKQAAGKRPAAPAVPKAGPNGAERTAASSPGAGPSGPAAASAPRDAGAKALDAAAPAAQQAGSGGPAALAKDDKSAAAAGPASPPERGVTGGEHARLEVDGSLALRYRGRKSGDAHDQDAYAVLALDVGDSAQDKVSGRFLGRLSADVDGRGDPESQATFSSLQDTHGDALHLDVYEASADVRHPFGAPARVRIGRQMDYATPEFAHFDGARVETDALGKSKIVVGAYAGVPVRFYEPSTLADDRMYGLWSEGRPWKDGRVRLDWMRVSQDADPGDFHDDLLALSVWQRLGPKLSVDGSFSRLENEDRDLRLRGTWYDSEKDFTLQASWYQLLNPLRAFASEFDPFYSTLQDFEPYSQARLLVSKAFGEHFRADAGGDVRRLEDSGDEGRLNHDYERGYATLVWSDGLARGLDVSLTGDAWNSDERDARTWGLDLTWKPNDAWRASIGSNYALYEYDVLSDVERDDVRTWYARVKRTLGKAWALDLGYEYDDDDFDDYQQVTVGATWHF